MNHLGDQSRVPNDGDGVGKPRGLPCGGRVSRVVGSGEVGEDALDLQVMQRCQSGEECRRILIRTAESGL